LPDSIHPEPNQYDNRGNLTYDGDWVYEYNYPSGFTSERTGATGLQYLRARRYDLGSARVHAGGSVRGGAQSDKDSASVWLK